MAIDIEAIYRCDMVVVAHPLADVRAGTGVATELNAAWWLKKAVFDFVPDIHYITMTATMLQQKSSNALVNYDRLQLRPEALMRHIDKDRPPVPVVEGPYLPWYQGTQCHNCFSRGWVVEQASTILTPSTMVSKSGVAGGGTETVFETRETIFPKRAVRCDAKRCNVPK